MGSLRGWGAGARAAGAVVALGYLLGFVKGPLTAVLGGLALVTLGRCAACAGSDDVVLGAALAVLGGALQIGALRWETLDLAQLRGAQAVLGPTVLVGPGSAAAASALAALAGIVGLSVWLATVRRTNSGSRLVRGLWLAEAAVGAFALVTVFWGGSVPRGSFGGADGAVALGQWVISVAAVGAAAVALATYVPHVTRWRSWILAGAGAALVGAAVLATTAVT